MKINNIFGDVFKEMPKFKDYEFNTIFSDLPYNLGSKIYIDKDDGKYKYKGEPKDFMGSWTSITSKQWETFAEQSFRVLKYGGYAIFFGMGEQFPLIEYYLIRAGFVKTQSIYWYYISNFPKSYDISSGIAKHDIIISQTDEHGNKIILSTQDLSKLYKDMKGSIKPLKQTVENIYAFRKELKTGGMVSDILAMHNGDNSISPACIDIEGNRVDYINDDDCKDASSLRPNAKKHLCKNINYFVLPRKKERGNPKGRFPANTFINEGTAKILDGQSGILKSGATKSTNNVNLKKDNRNIKF